MLIFSYLGVCFGLCARTNNNASQPQEAEMLQNNEKAVFEMTGKDSICKPCVHYMAFTCRPSQKQMRAS